MTRKKKKKTAAPGVALISPGKWQLRVKITRRGKVVADTIETHHGTLGSAIDRRAQIKKEEETKLVAQGKAQAPKMTLTVCSQLWTRELMRTEPSQRTATIYRNHLNDTILPACGHWEVRTITEQDVKNMRAHLEGLRKGNKEQYAQRTVSMWWWIFGAILKVGCKAEGVPSPAEGVRGPIGKKKGETGQAWTREELADMLGWCKQKRARHYPIITFLAETGVRQQAVRLLTWSDIAWKAGTARVIGKGNIPRIISLTPQVIEILRAHQKAQVQKWGLGVQQVFTQHTSPISLTDKGVYSLVMRLTNAWPGGTGGMPHDFRRSWIVRAAADGLSVAEIALHVGHKRLDQTLAYLRYNANLGQRTQRTSLLNASEGSHTPQKVKSVTPLCDPPGLRAKTEKEVL